MEKVSIEHINLMEEKSKLLKALAHPIRLCLLKQLVSNGETNVGDFVSCMNSTQSNISQHLSKLRDLGIVNSRKDGNQVFYSCDRKDVIEVIRTLMEN